MTSEDRLAVVQTQQGEATNKSGVANQSLVLPAPGSFSGWVARDYVALYSVFEVDLYTSPFGVQWGGF